MKKPLLAAFIITASTTSTSAIAKSDFNDSDATGIFLGVNYGYLRVEGEDNFNDDKVAYQGFVGYSMNDYFAFEGSYIDFGDYGNELANASTDGYTVGVRAGLPLSKFVNIYVRGGQLWYESDYKIGTIRNTTDDKGLFAGIGIAYKISADLAIKFDYTLYDSDLDIDEATANLSDSDFNTDLKFAAIGLEYTF